MGSKISKFSHSLKTPNSTNTTTKDVNQLSKHANPVEIDAATADIDGNDPNWFSKIVPNMIKEIDIKKQLLVIGYFRQNALNKHNIDNITIDIINYCIIYLYLHEELYIGNLHQLKDNANTRNIGKHIWTMFISSSKTELVEPKSIKEVTYHLHPTFPQSKNKVEKSPFYLQRIGWGTFDVEADIQFYKKYKRKDIHCSHYLDFEHHASITHIQIQKKRRKHKYISLLKEPEQYYFKNPSDYKVNNVEKEISSQREKFSKKDDMFVIS